MKKTIRDVNWEGKAAVMRCDFNVPLKDGAITDDTRIKAALPTINYLMEHGARTVIMSHLGRPKGKPVPEMSLAPVAVRLSEYLGKEVKFVPSDVVVDADVKKAASELAPGEVMLRKKRRTIMILPVSCQNLATSSCRRRSVPRTEHMLLLPALLISFLQYRGS